MFLLIRLCVVIVFFTLGAPDAVAESLSTTAQVGANKLDIRVQVEDLRGKAHAKIPVNKMLQLRVRVKSTDDKSLSGLKLVKFDAVMPSHNHGMVTKSQIEADSEHEYLISGVKLHMRGTWELRLDFEQASRRVQVAMPLNL